MTATRGPGALVGGFFAPNAPNLIDPSVFGGAGQATLEQLRSADVEQRLRPEALLVISPHWVSPGPFLVDDSPRPRFIEDFQGFPPELYGHVYAPPGDPELARLLVDEGVRSGLPVRASGAWGLDHGAWTALRPLAPSARLPVVPMSIRRASPSAHLDWGRAVARAVVGSGRRVVIVATGVIVHNFARIRVAAGAPPWIEGEKIERELLDRILAGDVDGVANFDRRKWAEVQPEGDLGPYFILAGALGGGFRPRLRSNERVFGSMGLSVIEFAPSPSVGSSA